MKLFRNLLSLKFLDTFKRDHFYQVNLAKSEDKLFKMFKINEKHLNDEFCDFLYDLKKNCL